MEQVIAVVNCCLEAREFCFLCDQEPESIDHIIAKCPFTREVWFYILQAIGKQLPQGAPSTISWWRRLRALSDGEQQKGMDSLFALVSWQIWKERNARCFRGVETRISDLLQIIKAEAD